MDVGLRTATELVASLRSKELSSRELLDHYLERVERLNPELNAVVTLDAERARERAVELDERTARGDFAGPLHGLPMTVKDVFETEGVRTTSGAPELADHVPGHDAVVVERLKAAGAVIFGKTNTPLYGGDLQTYNDVFGTTNNPWDLTRTPGGSSGGAAVAMAVGLSALECGSDIGGSARNPAHFCGVYGHKTTHGIVSTLGHIPGPPGSRVEADLGVVGPIARSASDLDLALGVLAGPSPDRSIAWRLELPAPRHERLADFRVAAWLDDPHAPVDGSVRMILERVADDLRAAGVKVDDAARPVEDLAQVDAIYQRLLQGVMAGGLPQPVFDAMVAQAASLGSDDDDARARMIRAITQRKRDWNFADAVRHKIRARWAEFFTRFDVLLAPAACTAAFPHDHRPFEQRTISVNGTEQPYFCHLSWAGLATAPLLPATVAPAGRTTDGLPVGVQIVGPYLEDRTTIAFARLIADVIGGFEPPPA